MKTVEKALDIIEAMNKNRGGASLSDLARLTGLDSSSVRRINRTLVKRGYLFQKQKRGKYLLGHRFLEYSGVSDDTVSLKEQAYPFLKELCEASSETVVMAVLEGFEAVRIADLVPDQMLRVVSEVRSKFPLYCTALGKMFLSHMPDERITHYLNITELAACTDNTITDRNQLISELETIRRDGVAFDDEEYMVGVRSVAAPITNENKAVLAVVSLKAPSVRMGSMKMRQISPTVKSCALRISQSLGYQVG